MILTFILAENKWIALVGVAVVVAILLVWIVASVAKRKKRAKKSAQEQLIKEQIEQGVEQRLMEIRNEYFVMPRNVTQSVGQNGQISAGKYVLKASVSGQDAFNVRLNGLVQECHDGDVVFLADMDTICPVSGAVLIKPVVD